LEALIERVLRCTWRRRSWELGGRDRASLEMHFGGGDRARLDDDLEAVDGRRTRCSDSIHQVVDSQTWECDKVTLPLSSHGELADGGQLCMKACRKLKLHPGVDS
jgi:hypothetical protein